MTSSRRSSSPEHINRRSVLGRELYPAPTLQLQQSPNSSGPWRLSGSCCSFCALDGSLPWPARQTTVTTAWTSKTFLSPSAARASRPLQQSMKATQSTQVSRSHSLCGALFPKGCGPESQNLPLCTCSPLQCVLTERDFCNFLVQTWAAGGQESLYLECVSKSMLGANSLIKVKWTF